MFKGRKVAATEAAQRYEDSVGRLRARFDERAADAQAGAPRAYPDGTPFHAEPHVTNVRDLGLAAGREGDMEVVGTCMQILLGYGHPELGPNRTYLANILGSRQLLLAKGCVTEERALSAAALNIDSYWEATGQTDALTEETRGSGQ